MKLIEKQLVYLVNQIVFIINKKKNYVQLYILILLCLNILIINLISKFSF